MKEFNANEFKPDASYKTEFAWEDVLACLNKRLDSAKFKEHTPCPKCNMTSENLIWIEFSSSKWTWRNRCGRQGPLSICPSCNIQVQFSCEIMN